MMKKKFFAAAVAAMMALTACGGAAAPLGKALVIFRKSRFDAPATVFIVR